MSIIRSPGGSTRDEALHADTPYRLLWSSGIIAFVLSAIAFLLWGISGTGTLFDMIVALCG
jgi:hypothetical protein